MEKTQNKVLCRVRDILKTSLDTAERECRLFWEYIRRNYLSLAVFSALYLLLFGSWLYHTNPRVDTDALINVPNSYFNWEVIGRQFGVFTKYVFGLQWFDPQFAAFAGYFLFCVAGVLFGYLFWRCLREKGALCAAFALAMFASPIMAEQYYFDMQIFEIAWAFILCAVSAGLTLYGAFRRRWFSLVLAALALLWSVGTYQSFAFLYVALIAFCFMLLYRRYTVFKERTVSVGQYGAAAGLSVAVFAAAVIVYCVITYFWFSGNAYAQEQLRWFYDPLPHIRRIIGENMREGFTGTGIYYTAFYGVFALLAAGVSVWDGVVSKNRFSLVYVAAAIFLQFVPFLLTVLFGGVKPVRSQFTYSFVLAADMLFLASRPWKYKLHRACNFGTVFIVLAAVALFSQLQVTARLVYTENIRAQEDLRVATEIEEEINRLSDLNKPVAFIGEYDQKLNNACYTPQHVYDGVTVIGYSVFNFFISRNDNYYENSNRICSFLQTVGFSFQPISAELMAEANVTAQSMPCWPQAGSVVDAGAYTVVKFSE